MLGESVGRLQSQTLWLSIFAVVRAAARLWVLEWRGSKEACLVAVLQRLRSVQHGRLSVEEGVVHSRILDLMELVSDISKWLLQLIHTFRIVL